MATAKKTPGNTRAAAKPTTKPTAPKAVVKPATKATTKPALKSPAKPAKAIAPAAAKPAAPQPAAVKPEKARKPKLVRDSFTIPKAEYVVIDALKERAAKLARPAKKSELLRAGIKALAGLSDTAFVAALAQVPAIKTGRPGKD